MSANKFNQPPGGIVTMMRLPQDPSPAGLVGAPCDIGISNRSGTLFRPLQNPAMPDGVER